MTFIPNLYLISVGDTVWLKFPVMIREGTFTDGHQFEITCKYEENGKPL
jgi:hypothetical protein